MTNDSGSVNTCLLFYGIRTSIRPFAASLAGVHKRVRSVEQELQLSTQLSFSTFERVAGKKSFGSPSCDTSFYSTPSPTPSRRGRRSWLPPLRFQVPDDRDHPALRPIAERPIIARQQTPFLHASCNGDPSHCIRRPASYIDKIFGMSKPTTEATSSIYRCYSSNSNLSRRLSTLSSHSEGSSESTSRALPNGLRGPWCRSDVPAIPTIPARYRHPGNSFRNGDRPVKAKSRPLRPPTEFWMYANGEQGAFNDLLNRRPQVAWPNTRHVRAKTICSNPVNDANVPNHPSTPAPPHYPVLRTNTNKQNIMRVEKRPYDAMRKGSNDDDGEEYKALCEDERNKVRRRSQTLVKKRQPWDQEPKLGEMK